MHVSVPKFPHRIMIVEQTSFLVKSSTPTQSRFCALHSDDFVRQRFEDIISGSVEVTYQRDNHANVCGVIQAFESNNLWDAR